MDIKEKYLFNALGRFKEMVANGECSKQDIAYWCGVSGYELDRRGASAGESGWVTKSEASKMMNVSTSTFDRIVLSGGLPRGKKVYREKALRWKREDVEQCKRMMMLKSSH